MDTICVSRVITLLAPFIVAVVFGVLALIVAKRWLRSSVATRISQAVLTAVVVSAVIRVAEEGDELYCAGLCTMVDSGVISWWTAFLAGCWC